MELRSQKKHLKSASIASTFNDDGGNVYLSINNIIIQIIDVSKVMESNMIVDETDSSNKIKVENDFDTVIEMDQETVSPKLQKTIQVRQSKKKTSRNKTKMKAKSKKKIPVKNYRASTKPTTPAMCDICGKSFCDTNYLKNHIKRHNEAKDFKCTMCDKAFKMIGDLGNHIKTHLNERAFSCAICDKRFTRSSLLNYHMRIHTGERPYECNICHMTFTRPFGLSQHKLRVHSRNKGKNIGCTEKGCGKMFVTLFEREEHVAVAHKWSLPHKCSICQQSFSNRGGLYVHKRNHSSDESIVCPSSGCDKKFKVYWSYKCHMDSCHKDFIYKCPHCPSEFKKKSELNQHMKVSNSHKTCEK